jgi:hypothetical protein
MASFVKFNSFVEDLAEKVHNLASDTLRVMLLNTAPNAADIRVDTDEAVCQLQATSNANEIAAGNGYTKKGPSLDVSSSGQTSGTYKLIVADEVITASGDVGPFRYPIVYNDTGGTSDARPVISSYDYGSSITLHNGETFTLDFSATDGLLQLA